MNEVLYAGFWRRAVASVLDQFAVQIVSGVLVFVVLMLYGVDPKDLSGTATQGISSLATAVVFLTYHPFCLVKWGSTPGRRILGVKVVDAQTLQGLTGGKALGRTLGYFLSGIVLMLGYLMAAFDSKKRALHDRLAGTVCIRMPG